METIPAKTGWLWVKEGFALFRKQPMELATLFLSYTFLMLGVGIVPVLGQVLPLILTPVFSMAFMEACVQVERGQRVYPSVLLAGFRSPAFQSLVQLGLLYLLAAVIATAASALVDGGTFWNIITGQAKLDTETARNSDLSLAMLFAGVVYTPAAMAFWYAAPLIMWKGMGIGKAVFYSFFSVKRAGKAFIVYGLSWLLIGALVPAFLSSLIAIIAGKAAIGTMVLIPLWLIMSVVLYCSFYPTYTYIFGKKEPESPVAS